MMVRIFRELTIFGEPGTLELLISLIESRLNDGWSRDREGEQRLRLGSKDQYFLFPCGSNAEHPAVVLAMLLEGGTLKVVNIFPQEIGEITKDQYNSVLVGFHLRFLHEAALELGTLVELSSDERTIEEAFHPEVLRRLETFVVTAEGLWSKPSWSHRCDQDRLFTFLLEANLHSNKIETGLLRHWLEHDRHWPANKVDQLLAEIEFGADLLAYGDENLFRRMSREVPLTSKSPAPTDEIPVDHENAPVESESPSRSARMRGAVRRLVLSLSNAIARTAGNAQAHRSGRQSPVSGLPALEEGQG